MKYVILLRGINVGGNNKINMAQLKNALELAGFENVTTYINSGNILLDSHLATNQVNQLIKRVITDTFELVIDIITIAKKDFLAIAAALPRDWTNDNTMRCDCLFLWPGLVAEDSVKQLNLKSGIDQVKTAPGAIFWAIDRDKVMKSALPKIIGTPFYKQVTIRNCNTVRKLADMLQN